MIKHRQLCVMATICWLVMTYMYAMAGDENTGPPDDDKLQKMIKILKSMDKPIEFYGKVVDQDNSFVQDSKVIVHIGHSTGIKEIIVNTDSKGLFELKKEIGNQVYIDKIIKKGYEFSFIDNNDRAFDYAAPLEKNLFRPDKHNPIVFIMRKKEAPTLVIPNELRLGFDERNKGYELDLISEKTFKLGKVDKSEHVDLQIIVGLSEDKTNYTVSFITPDENSGVVLSDELLYVVPAEGYKQSETVTLSITEKATKHLYVKGRGGNIYSRIDIEFYANMEKIGMGIKAWTNLNGLRNVDYDPDVYIEHVRKKSEERKRKIIEREEKIKKLK